MPDVAVELDERAGIEQPLEALAREQLALRALPLDRLLGALVERPSRISLETLELRPGRVPRPPCAPIVSDLAPWPAPSTARPSGPCARCRGTFLVRRATRIRRASPPRRRSASSTAATRSSSRRAWRPQRRPHWGCSARQDRRARAGGVLRHPAPPRGARALGAVRRRVRPDGRAAGRRRSRLGRGAVEPASSRFPTSTRRPRIPRPYSSTRPRRRRSFCGRSSTAPTSCSTARRSTSAATTTCCSARLSSGTSRRTTGSYACARALARSPLPTRPGSCSAACRRSSSASAAVRDGARARAAARRRTSVESRALPGPRARSARRALHEGGFGGLLSFDVPRDAARRSSQPLELIANATSLGGVHSTIEGRYRWEGDRVPAGLLRAQRRARGRRRQPVESGSPGPNSQLLPRQTKRRR